MLPTPPSSETEPQEDKLYEVNEILDHKRENGKDYWYISWLGYGLEDNSWEPDDYVRDDAADAIYEYLSKQARDSDFTTTAVSLPAYFFYPSPDESFCSSSFSEEYRPVSSSSLSSDFE
jgi:hypothetical protein